MAQAEYSATIVIPSVGAVAAVKRLPCRISQFAPYGLQGVTQKGKIKYPQIKNFLCIYKIKQ